MTTSREAERAFWRGVLAGGATAIPRWTREPGARVGSESVAVPAQLVSAVDRTARVLGVEAGAVVLAAHARVLAALIGEAEVLMTVVDAAVDPERAPYPCRLDTAVGSWRALVADAAAVREHARGIEFSGDVVEELRADPGLVGVWPETVLDLAGPAAAAGVGALAPGVVLRVGWLRTELGCAVVRTDHRGEVLDADEAARVAGYHVTALSHLVEDVGVEPGAGGLVTGEELRFQLDGLAGPVRRRPDRPAHELIREQATAHPEVTAVRLGDISWSYRVLDERSDQIARALLVRGLEPEGIVAVVAERTLGWAASVLGILKAGGAYLPLEPGFPPERIRKVISRAGARLVLSEDGATASLDRASTELDGVERVLVEDAFAEDHGTAVVQVAVSGDRLAYLYFTSGTTGEPKGAMCEHAGMLNHLFAKIEDLGIGEGTVVAQTAPQCFDISLWQLVAPWLVGGTTVLVEQETVLDVPRFVELLAARGVQVAQLVPSYLDVVVSHLEQHAGDPALALPALHTVAVTGEAVKKELVARWFAVRPQIPLVNAYGLTETCDDTNHEILYAVPETERVPLGPAVPNVAVSVVDEHLRLVPLGAPGEIVFSGVCVGRGYVNDPERTAAVFGPDPLRPGRRLYRSGDHGRWLPSGKLDFLGRRDHQVKISGFRIEIGEVENTLLRAPGVRDAAVVALDRPGKSKHLVGFYGAADGIEDAMLRATLSATLPGYMVPPVLHHRDQLPLTANGKIDRKALTALAADLDDIAVAETPTDAPVTATEHRLAAVWAPLLGVEPDQVNRTDNFFDRGGSSLLAVKMAVRLDRAVTLPEIGRHPVLADLAALIDQKHGASPAAVDKTANGAVGQPVTT